MFSSCVLPRERSETMRVRDRSTTPSVSSSHQVRGSIYHAYNFQLTLPSYRIDRLLDPTTSYLCLSYKPKQPCSPHPSNPLFGHVPFLLNHLVCMLGCYQLFLLLRGLGYHI